MWPFKKNFSFKINDNAQTMHVDKVESKMLTFLIDNNMKLSLDHIESKFKFNQEIDLEKVVFDDEWNGYILKINYLNNEYIVKVYDILAESEKLNYLKNYYPYASYFVTEEHIEKAIASSYVIYTEMYFSDNHLESYHLQLKILHILGGLAHLVEDLSANKIFSGDWLEYSASRKEVLSLEYLYSIQNVFDDDLVWLHTHGLCRVGLADIDLIDKIDNADELYGYIRHLIKYLLSNKEEYCFNNIVFQFNSDTLCILVDTKAGIDISANLLKKDANTMLGGHHLRDDAHGNKRSLVFIVDNEDSYSLVSSAQEMLRGNTMYYISDEETSQMASRARESLNDLFVIYEEQKNNNWSYWLKIGYPTDNNEAGGFEHLWFKAVSMEHGSILATLQNEPYYIASMQYDNDYVLDLSLLTEWFILNESEDERFDPDNIFIYKTLYSKSKLN